MEKVTIYLKRTCSKSRGAESILRELGVPFEAVEYHKTSFTVQEFKALLVKLGMSARELLRSSEEVYRKLSLGERELNEDELIELMTLHPDLIQRPIIESGDRAILARPPERVHELLGTNN